MKASPITMTFTITELERIWEGLDVFSMRLSQGNEMQRDEKRKTENLKRRVMRRLVRDHKENQTTKFGESKS